MVSLFFLTLLLFFLLSIVIWSVKNGISPMPSSVKAHQSLLSLIPTNGPKLIVDLGSGWGNLAFSIAKKFPDALVIGYESSPIPFLFSKCWYWLNPLPNLQFQRQDFFKISLRNADVIVCYLYPEAMRKLQKKLSDELENGTWVITNTFALPEWQATQIHTLNDLYQTKIYTYQIKKENIL